MSKPATRIPIEVHETSESLKERVRKDMEIMMEKRLHQQRQGALWESLLSLLQFIRPTTFKQSSVENAAWDIVNKFRVRVEGGGPIPDDNDIFNEYQRCAADLICLYYSERK